MKNILTGLSRHLVKVIMIGLLGILLVLAGKEIFRLFKGEKRYVRYEVHSKEGARNLKAMDSALKIMRSLPCDNPLSWYYQGAIHWIPDTIKNNSLCNSYHTPADLKEAWDNCTHSPSGKEKLHFLLWHRMYIWHFEKIVRKLSGYKDFALPYWEYTNPRHRTLPDMLRTKGSSLYESCRFDGLNNGYPMSGEIERALDITDLMNRSNYKTFCYQINSAPHGAVHDYCGAGNDTTGTLQFNNPITGGISNTGLMGWVPTAGFDPVFWTHHSEIDRIWQKWTNSENGKAATYDELKDTPWPYIFFDENGKKVEYTLKQVLDIVYGEMDYDFSDGTKLIPKSPATLTTAQPEKILASSDKPVVINSQITDAVTQLALPLTGNHPKMVKLVLTVSYVKLPRGVYEVYLNNNNEFKGSPDEEFVGFMTFFGTDHKMSGEGCKKGCCTPLTKGGRPTFTFEYEIPYSRTNKIQIYKHGGVKTGDLIIEKIEIKL